MSNRSRQPRNHRPSKRKPDKYQKLVEQVVALHSTTCHDGQDFDPHFCLCPCDQMNLVLCFGCQEALIAFARSGEPCEHAHDLTKMGWHLQ